MVALIGLITMGALVWVLHVGMANESDAERRRLARLGLPPGDETAGRAQHEQDGTGARVAA